MTLTTQIDRVSYAGNGVTVAFPFQGRIFARTDLAVTVFAPVTGTPTTLVLDVDYTVTGPNNRIDLNTGVTVTTVTPVADGATILIVRVLVPIQTTDLTNQGRFLPEIHEDRFDFLTALAQQSIYGLARAPLLGELDVDGAGAYRARQNRISGLRDGVNATDAATVGQIEDILQNIQTGASALQPRLWRATATVTQNVYQIPGATLSRPESYVVLINGLQQDPATYVVDVDQAILVLDAYPPEGANVVIRALGFVEALSTSDIDASGVVSGVFTTDRLGVGAASAAVFLAGGPSGPTWTATLGGPFTATGDVTTGGQFLGAADASLITTGVMTTQRLGTGSFSGSTVLHGDGVFRIPAIMTTTGFSVNDAEIPADVYTAIVLTGSQTGFNDSYATVQLFIGDGTTGTDVEMRGYVTNFQPEIFGTIDGPSVFAQPFSSTGSDFPQFINASFNNEVLMRHENQLQFKKIEVANIAATGTPSNTTFYRGDGAWATISASLPTTTSDPLNGTVAPAIGNFFRGDQQWSSVLRGAIGVQNTAATRLLWLNQDPSQASINATDAGIINYFPIRSNSIWEFADGSSNYLGSANDPDRVRVNGRMFAARLRHNGATYGGAVVNASATGSLSLDINVASYWRLNCIGLTNLSLTDGGTDPLSADVNKRIRVEVVPNGNTVNLPSATWPGGITPTVNAGINVFEFTFRSGDSTPLGRVLFGGSVPTYSDEQAQDAVGSIFVPTATIVPTYSDATPSMSWAVAPASIGATQLAPSGVTSGALADGAVTNLKVAAATLSLDRLSATGVRDATTALFGDNTWKSIPGGQAPITWRDEGSTVGTAITSVNFTGAGVTSSALGAALTVNIPGGGAGSTIIYNNLSGFVANSSDRPNLTADTGLEFFLGGTGEVRLRTTGGGGSWQSAILFRDEGTALGAAGTVTEVDFVGAGVTASRAANKVTVTVPGTGSSILGSDNTWTGTNTWTRRSRVVNTDNDFPALALYAAPAPTDGNGTARGSCLFTDCIIEPGVIGGVPVWHTYWVKAARAGFDVGVTHFGSWSALGSATQAGYGYANWTVANTPGQGQTWNSGAVGCAEWNVGNRFADFGLIRDFGGAQRWCYFQSYFPDTLAPPDGAPYQEFPVTFGTIYGPGYRNDNSQAVGIWIPISIQTDTCPDGGIGISIAGGSTSARKPLAGIEFRGQMQRGIDFASATLTATNQPAVRLATNQRIHLGGNAYLWFDGTNVKCTNGTSTVNIV